MIAACHVLCPNRPMFLDGPESYRQYFVDRRNEGITLGFIRGRPVACSILCLPPHAAWECWKYEAEATFLGLGDGRRLVVERIRRARHRLLPVLRGAGRRDRGQGTWNRSARASRILNTWSCCAMRLPAPKRPTPPPRPRCGRALLANCPAGCSTPAARNRSAGRTCRPRRRDRRAGSRFSKCSRSCMNRGKETAPCVH